MCLQPASQETLGLDFTNLVLAAQWGPTLQPHELSPTRLLCPWNSPGQRTGVGCHFMYSVACKINAILLGRGGCVSLKMLGLFYTLHELFSSGLLQHVGVAHTLGTLQAIRCWPCVEDSGWWMVYVTINESCCFQDVILPDSQVLCVIGRREGLEWHSQRAASVSRLCASSGLCSWGNSSLRTPVLGRLFSKNPLLFLSEMKKAVLQKALGALVEMENFKQS